MQNHLDNLTVNPNGCTIWTSTFVGAKKNNEFRNIPQMHEVMELKFIICGHHAFKAAGISGLNCAKNMNVSIFIGRWRLNGYTISSPTTTGAGNDHGSSATIKGLLLVTTDGTAGHNFPLWFQRYNPITADKESCLSQNSRLSILWWNVRLCGKSNSTQR